MENFTDAQITSFAHQAEIQLTAESDSLVDRYAVPIISGQTEYQLPTRIIDVRRITYRGKKLDPFSGQDLIWSGSTPNTPAQGIPKFYTYSYKGYPVIKLYPAPSENLPTPVDSLWTVEGIRNSLCVEFVSEPDFTSGSDLRIPSTIRRQYVKDFVMYRCFKREGKGMDPRAATYFKMKFEMDKAEHREISAQIFKCIPAQLEPYVQRKKFVGRPVLPPRFGEIVE